MKTFSKTLVKKEYESPIAYGYKPSHKVKSYIKIQMHFDFKEGLRFSVAVPNMSVCKTNPISAILRVLEHESIGMQKYERMKEDSRACGVYNKLDPDAAERKRQISISSHIGNLNG